MHVTVPLVDSAVVQKIRYELPSVFNHECSRENWKLKPIKHFAYLEQDVKILQNALLV